MTLRGGAVLSAVSDPTAPTLRRISLHSSSGSASNEIHALRVQRQKPQGTRALPLRMTIAFEALC